ncbi:MAG TPA: hypothetical protein PKM43_03500 [Verrucomicrobiota bacterium]|nr:hypothetical protein [Verrucomicrobiota bacterium]HRZ34767.1 hypothetical protein [Candidatus Paceibacterota bacterium]HRZ53950.1 hypothetical protein [Candidatus Paceibacterota bacterium]
MRRPRSQLFVAWCVFGAAALWSAYEWIFVNEGLRYFSQDWSRVLLLCTIVVIGTPILLGYLALSAECRRRVELWGVGCLAAATTGLALHVLYSAARMAAFLSETGGLWLLIASVLFLCIMAAGFWWAFWRVWNRKPV